MLGSAVVTTRLSSMTMNSAAETSARVQPVAFFVLGILVSTPFSD